MLFNFYAHLIRFLIVIFRDINDKGQIDGRFVKDIFDARNILNEKLKLGNEK